MKNFPKTIQLLKREFSSIEIPDDNFINWFRKLNKNGPIREVFELENLRSEAISSLPKVDFYMKTRLESISAFEETCKKDKIMEMAYEFNPNTKLIITSVDIDLNCFELSTLKVQKENFFYFFRRSVTHPTGIFENKIEGWNKLLVDIYLRSTTITGEDLYEALKEKMPSVTLDEVRKFLSNNVVYYDTLRIAS